ncbi:MAG: XdhC family protein [Gammaproteobacteria bacterium]|nr:XdhC family protein [Gammaproteobacteria bacterium]
MAKDILNVLAELQAKGEPYAVATVVETTGSVSAKISSKAVVDQDGRVVSGWIGGGCAESITCDTALKSMVSGEPRMIDIDLDSDMLGKGMPCGGKMRVYVEPVLPKPSMWIIGHGRVAESLCIMADLVGLNVIVIDPDVEWEQYPNASRLIIDDSKLEQLKPGKDDYLVIATQAKDDHEMMSTVLATEAHYIALIASRKRSRLVQDYLRKEGYKDSDLQRVMMPSGLDLGARLPEEIALCVISEITMLRRGGTGMRMRDKLQLEAVQTKAAG